MAKCWSVTTFAALALLCCLAGRKVEAQYVMTKTGPPPAAPQLPSKPQYPQPQTPSKPQYPQPQTPSKPQYPQPQTPTKQLSQDFPKGPQYPQPQTPPKPQYPQPQTPSKPQYPQPQTPTKQLSQDFPKGPQYPQPQTPPKPQYPRPQVPTKPQNPTYVTKPKTQTAISQDFPQYPQPQTPSKPQYPQPQVPTKPQTPGFVSMPKTQTSMSQDLPQGPQYPQPQYPKPQTPSKPQYPGVPATPPGKGGLLHDQNVQDPKIPPQKPQPQLPATPPVKSCDVDRHVRVPCGIPGISADACDAIDCCYDGQQCYFGRAVTLQCTKDAHFIVVVARDVTLPNIDLETISLLGGGPGCAHVDSNSAFAIYHFPVTACGSVVMEEPGVIIYENRMTSSYEVGVGHLGEITRDSSYELLFQCRYIGTSVETLLAEVLPLDNPPLPVADFGPISVHMRLGNGQCLSKGCNEVDAAYTSYYMDADYPVTKVLRDPVYVEVMLLDRTDPSLVLTLGRCWATASPNAHSLPQWDILIDGCPYRDDRYLSALVPVGPSSGLEFPSHYRRFLFKMFTFVDPLSMEPLREKVYIHCSTAVCVPGQGANCEPSCFRKKRDTEAVEQTMVEPKVVVSSKEVIMIAAEE